MPDRPSPSLDPAELLAQRAWMRRFAAALAGAEGEDLVQDAWVRVLSAPDPALARPRAWLASVMRNAARMGQRGAIRREQREAQAAREEALASTDELAAQAELEQLAVRAVLALPAPYRQALLLRYVGGLEPSEIARQLELPPATVRSRIARGLAEVRSELDRRHGRREAWLALLAPEAVVRGGTAAVVVGGGIGMSTKWIAAAALAAAAALLWVGRPGRTHALHAPESSAASAGELAAPAPLAAEPMADPSLAAEATERREPLPANVLPATSTATELLVHVTWERDGSPAADVPLRVESLDVEPYRRKTTGTTDASGTARFAALPSGEQWIDTLRDAYGSVDLVPGETATLDLAIPPGVDVDCRVVDRDGVGVDGAEVWLFDDGDVSSGIVVGETDAGGRLFLRDLPGQDRALGAHARAYAPSVQRLFRGNPGTRLEIELVLPGPGASLAGLVEDARGEPLAGIAVLVGEEFPPAVQREDGVFVVAAPGRLAATDAGGRFLLHGLSPGPLEVQARASGYGTGRASVELAAGETGHCTVVLEAEARVAGVVRDEDGRPLARVHVTGLRPVGEGDLGFSGCETFTAADGSYVLRGLEAGPCLLGASSETNLNGGAQTELELRAGEEARWDVVLVHGGSLGGVVLDERGAPLARWLVTAVEPERPGPEYWLRSTYSDAAGSFRMENCPAQRFVLALRAPEEQSGDPALVLEDFRVGDEALVLRVMDAWRPSAFVEGRLVAADGAPLVEAQVIFEATVDDFPYLPDADGRFRIGPLRTGEYWLHADAEGRGEVRTPRFALAFGETKDVGELVLERCGWIRVHAVAMGGGALPAGTVLDEVALLRDGERWGEISLEDLQGRSDPLGAGTYVVHARERSWCAADVEVELRPGATAEIELAFEPATQRRIDVVFADGVPAGLLYLRALDADGRVFEERHYREVEGRYTAWLGGLLLGSYSIEARAPDGRSATGELCVLDLADDDTPLVLTLR